MMRGILNTMVVKEEVMNVFWTRRTLMKQQYLSSTLRNRSKLPSVELFWFSIMYRHKNWKKDDEFRNCSLTVQSMLYVCVLVMRLSVQISLSNAELLRDYRGKRTEIRIKNNTMTCFAFRKDLSVQRFELNNSFSGGVERLFCAVLDF